jgi:hypothetical protein
MCFVADQHTERLFKLVKFKLFICEFVILNETEHILTADDNFSNNKTEDNSEDNWLLQIIKKSNKHIVFLQASNFQQNFHLK